LQNLDCVGWFIGYGWVLDDWSRVRSLVLGYFGESAFKKRESISAMVDAEVAINTFFREDCGNQ
jgi:hypothetical protein